MGIVHSFGPVDGADDTLETRIAMRFADNYANNWVLDTAATGELPIDLMTDLNRRFDLSYITPDKLAALREGTVDFLGLNYYSRVLVKPYTDGETSLVVNNSGKAFKGSQRVVIKGWFEQVLDDPNMQTTEWGTEIYPDGLRRGLIEVTRRYHLPIYITENGIGVAEDVTAGEVQDDYRISFMKDHIAAIQAAQEAGADVRGYFVWSTFDLYSWKNGCRKRYGLVAVDFENGYTRTPKKSYRWYRDTLCEHLKEMAAQGKGNVYDLMGKAAEQSKPGANGVLFAPYMSGERCPYPDPNARGVFYGLSLSSTRGDITRAVMEGVTYSLRQLVDLMNSFVSIEKVYTSGGGSVSPLWRQMQADIFDLPVYTMSASGEGGAYGAILVAGVGAGVWGSLEEAASIIQVETETLPIRENQKAYQDAYSLYCELYGALKPVYDKGAALAL